MLTDTHCHIHHPGLVDEADAVVARAHAAGVERLVIVGCDGADSRASVEMARRYDNAWATIGLHPLDSRDSDPAAAMEILAELATDPQVVAIGECGLDYSRGLEHTDTQIRLFRQQIELALAHDLPMVWHVRDAFPDFFAVTANYPELRGIVHCFTSTMEDMQEAVSRGYLIALNGIMTFTRQDWQLAVAKAVPLENLVLETDCPFLAPVPERGHTNEPAFLRHTAQFLADLRGESLDELAVATNANVDRILKLV